MRLRQPDEVEAKWLLEHGYAYRHWELFEYGTDLLGDVNEGEETKIIMAYRVYVRE